jgi:hypothetical protein
MSAATDKTKKLLALAARQAESLMAKHEIDEFDLLMSEGQDWDAPAQSIRPGKRTPASRVPGWINVIAFGVKTWTNTRSLDYYGGFETRSRPSTLRSMGEWTQPWAKTT